MKQSEKKYLRCILNADSVDFAVGQDEIINGENVRFGSTDAGVIGTIESVGSTILKSSFQPSVSTVVIGSADDTANNRILYFVKDLYGPWDKILCYSLANDIVYTVLLSEQVVGGLSFDKNELIHSTRIENGVLYWTDNLNEPRKINIDAGIKLNQPSYNTSVSPYVSPLNQEVLTIIRRPPFYAPTLSKQTDGTFVNNFIANSAQQFSLRYRYREYEYSVIGAYSYLAPYNNKTETTNFIRVTIPLAETIDQDVIEAELIVKFDNGNNAFIIHTWNRTDIDLHNAGTALTYDFYNDISGLAVDVIAVNKPFDSVPLLSQTLEIAQNRIFLGNNLEGYDTPTITSLEIGVATVSGGGYDAVWGLYQMIFSFEGHQVESYSYYAAYIPTLGTYFLFIEVSTGPLPATKSALDAEVSNTSVTTDIGDYLINNGYTGGFDWDFYVDFFETDPNNDPYLPATLTITDLSIPVTEGQRAARRRAGPGGDPGGRCRSSRGPGVAGAGGGGAEPVDSPV
jgi:hypothetical protein